jgi:formylglycine-generating enzyme required for sulfatase activity
MLHELVSGRAPFPGAAADEVVDRLRSGELPELADDVPVDLATVCRRAMHPDPAARHAHAGAIADEVRDWLDGTTRRERGLAAVQRAERAAAEATDLLERAHALDAQAREALRGVKPSAPEQHKHAGWSLQDQAGLAARAARMADLEVVRSLHAALEAAPDLPEAHAAFVIRHRERQRAAEAMGDLDGSAEAEISLRHHAAALPPGHAERGRAERWLTGAGALTLVTEPPGAEVLLHRFEVRNRRSITVFERSLGHTPLHAAPLAMGSHLLVLRRTGFDDVRYPVHLQREQHHDGVAPGQTSPTPIVLPAHGTLGADDVLVPAGPTLTGDPRDGLRTVWVDAFVMRRHPVTNAEYLRFLDGLVARGREDQALRYAPRERPGTLHGDGALIYGRLPDGRFTLTADADGHVWQPDWPVICVDLVGSEACAREAGWRLPFEAEWEKAARGVDGRRYPWGEHFDPSWACTTLSHPGVKSPAPIVDGYPVDESVYGVRHLAGNVRQRCLDAFHSAPGGPLAARVEGVPGEMRVVRGGSWGDAEGMSVTWVRSGLDPNVRGQRVGLRFTRSWPG